LDSPALFLLFSCDCLLGIFFVSSVFNRLLSFYLDIRYSYWELDIFFRPFFCDRGVFLSIHQFSGFSCLPVWESRICFGIEGLYLSRRKQIPHFKPDLWLRRNNMITSKTPDVARGYIILRLQRVKPKITN